MSLAALAKAVRDTLRTDLTRFYDDNSDTIQAKNRAANCRVMPDEKPTPACGDEFISVYGNILRPRSTELNTAIEEQYGIIIAVTRRISSIPFDDRGEVGYITDGDFYLTDWMSVEGRCREIVGLLDKNYELLRAAEEFFNNQNGYSEPLYWVGTDAAPTQVGAEHFHAYHAGIDAALSNEIHQLPGVPEADPVYGLLMKVRFDGAIRFQPKGEYDT